jgi:hypothetical protein
VDAGGGVASLPHSRFFLRSGMRRGAVAPGVVGVADEEEEEEEEGDDDDWTGLGGKEEVCGATKECSKKPAHEIRSPWFFLRRF